MQTQQNIEFNRCTNLRSAFGQHTSASWNRTLRRFDDANIYQTWAWGKVKWGLHQMRHIVIYQGHHVIAAAQARVIQLPFCNFGAAYIPWGPLIMTGKKYPDLHTRKLIWNAIFEEFTKKRGLYLWIQPHHYDLIEPTNNIEQSDQTIFIPIKRPSYHTIIINLTQDLNEIRKKLKRNWRNHLVKSETINIAVHVSTELNELDAFNHIYKNMKSFKSFHSDIKFNDIRSIQQKLPNDEKLVIFIAYVKNKPVAGAVCTLTGNTSIYLLGATDQIGRESNASYYLHWQIIKWLKSNGIKYYDLGGINQDKNPGGYSFKNGFGGSEAQFPSWIRTVSENSSSIFNYLLKIN